MFTHPKIRFAILIAAVLSLAGCDDSPKVPEDIGQPSAELSGKLQQFFAVKEGQARELVELDKKWQDSEKLTIPPEVWSYFAAAHKGDWRKVALLYYSLSARSYQFEQPKTAEIWRSTVWQPVNETFRAYEQLCCADPKHTLAYGREILDSMPPGSVFFAGTDAGRFVTTFLAKSQATGDPVFIISQNALTDGLYLSYLRSMYGGKIHVPSTEESESAFTNYLADAAIRLAEHRLKPNEDVKLVNGTLQISGQVAVMEINELMAKTIFNQTPDREFFIDPQIPLDWIASNAIPHGFVFKINRTPQDTLNPEVVGADREFWSQHIKRMLGDWFSEKSSIVDISNFTERVYLRKDLSGFTGDAQFVQTVWPWRPLRPFLGAGATYSKSRSNIAKHYAWRADNSTSATERDRMNSEADLAFRQALALCPYQTDTLNGYLLFLQAQKRADDMEAVLKLAREFYPDDKVFQMWLQQTADSLHKN